MEIEMTRFQIAVATWSKKNFPKQERYHPLLGLIEEVGELAHAHLKREQRIRTRKSHIDQKCDAIGDIVIYLADYCARNNLDLEGCVRDAWEKVEKRDWVGDPEEGVQHGG